MIGAPVTADAADIFDLADLRVLLFVGCVLL